MHSLTPTRNQRPSPQFNLRSIVAWLCIILILAVGAAHLFHQHPDSGNPNGDDPGCSLCAVAHLTVLHTPAITTGPVVAQSFTTVRQDSEVAAPPRYFAPSLRVRPPPVLTPQA